MERLAAAGFAFEAFPRYPQLVGAVRDGCVALLEPTSDGLRLLGAPGWRLGEAIGVLVEKQGRLIFQAKSETLEATPERLETLHRVRADLERALIPSA